MNSSTELDRCLLATIKKFKSITKKKKKHDEITLLEKTNLDCVKGTISRSLTDSCIECDYFDLIDMLKECEDMAEEIKNLKT